MTREEMNNIDEEITYIEKKLAVLSLDNLIENQEREKLLSRLDFLEYQIDCSIANKKKKSFKAHFLLIDFRALRFFPFGVISLAF